MVKIYSEKANDYVDDYKTAYEWAKEKKWKTKEDLESEKHLKTANP